MLYQFTESAYARTILSSTYLQISRYPSRRPHIYSVPSVVKVS